jgi:hypothetical protein
MSFRPRKPVLRPADDTPITAFRFAFRVCPDLRQDFRGARVVRAARLSPSCRS